MPRIWIWVLSAVLLVAQPGGAFGSEFTDAFGRHLEAGRTKDAAAFAEARLAEAPGDPEATFALGAAQFLGAVEGLGQGFYRYGLRATYDRLRGLTGLPLLRLPVPENPAPEEATYEAVRALLARFVDDLGRAEATLAGIGTEDVLLPLDMGAIRLDLDGDGAGSETEALWRILAVIAGARGIAAEEMEGLAVDFDSSDIPWLRAYCHLLSAIAEVPLAHDFEETFEVTFPGIFHMPNSPYARLGAAGPEAAARLEALGPAPPRPEAAEDGAAEREAMRLFQEDRAKRSSLRNRMQYAGIVDLIAFVHLNRWEVVEPGRMRSAHAHLLSVVELGRENWRRIRAETDDGAEWIPNPAQTGVLPGLVVDEDIVDGWLAFLDEFEALLAGEKLLPHWRFDEGINLGRVFLEPRTLDLVLMIQGAGAIPYLEAGEMTDSDTWRRIMVLMRGDFFRYAVWFN